MVSIVLCQLFSLCNFVYFSFIVVFKNFLICLHHAIKNAIAAITPKQHHHASVKAALTAKAAVTRDDCRTFFKLLAEYDPNASKCISIGSVASSTKVASSVSKKLPQLKHKPKQMGFLLRKLVHDVRQRALRRVFRAYR